jgi:hypothetical protein
MLPFQLPEHGPSGLETGSADRLTDACSASDLTRSSPHAMVGPAARSESCWRLALGERHTTPSENRSSRLRRSLLLRSLVPRTLTPCGDRSCCAAPLGAPSRLRRSQLLRSSIRRAPSCLTAIAAAAQLYSAHTLSPCERASFQLRP